MLGDNKVPSEDALVLQLQLTKGQEKFVETLKSQQADIVDLQQKLAEQQTALVTQQREIIMQQRKMYEQMDLIKVQYGMLFDTVKQMSFKGLQEDIQHYFEANLQSLQKEVRNHLQKSYSVHKLNVDAKMIDIGEPLMECGLCESDEFCNFQKAPSQCEKCTLCPAGFFQLLECSANADRICQVSYYYVPNLNSSFSGINAHVWPICISQQVYRHVYLDFRHRLLTIFTTFKSTAL